MWRCSANPGPMAGQLEKRSRPSTATTARPARTPASSDEPEMMPTNPQCAKKIKKRNGRKIAAPGFPVSCPGQRTAVRQHSPWCGRHFQHGRPGFPAAPIRYGWRRPTAPQRRRPAQQRQVAGDCPPIRLPPQHFRHAAEREAHGKAARSRNQRIRAWPKPLNRTALNADQHKPKWLSAFACQASLAPRPRDYAPSKESAPSLAMWSIAAPAISKGGIIRAHDLHDSSPALCSECRNGEIARQYMAGPRRRIVSAGAGPRPSRLRVNASAIFPAAREVPSSPLGPIAGDPPEITRRHDSNPAASHRPGYDHKQGRPEGSDQARMAPRLCQSKQCQPCFCFFPSL